ncbi:hypothetical protein DFJ73DRAFT_960967 [Zopfochytrium polystomum]|nr:hypothetical protein DFJ73DRAFT_960967 [Zopfochytrium polystomum]
MQATPLPTSAESSPAPSSAATSRADDDITLADPSLPTAHTRGRVHHADIPLDIWQKVAAFLADPFALASTCTSMHDVITAFQAKLMWSEVQFNKLAVFTVLRMHPKLASVPLVKALIHKGAIVPRYLIQVLSARMEGRISAGMARPDEREILDLLVETYTRRRTEAMIKENPEFSTHIPAGSGIMPLTERQLHDLTSGDDSRLFIHLMNDPSPVKMAILRELIHFECFVPLVREVPAFRFYQLCCISPELFNHLVYVNGFDPTPINDAVLKWAVNANSMKKPASSAPPAVGEASVEMDETAAGPVPSKVPALSELIQTYGFNITPSFISTILTEVNPSSVPDVLVSISSALVNPSNKNASLTPENSPPLVHECIRRVVWEILGPSGEIKPGLLSQLLQSRWLSTDEFQRAFLVPGGIEDGLPFRSRCYEAGYPYGVWRWVLNEFGPDHPFTEVSFDGTAKPNNPSVEWHLPDLMQWLGDLPSRLANFHARPTDDIPPSEIPLMFLKRGVTLRPRHVINLVRSTRGSARSSTIVVQILNGVIEALRSISNSNGPSPSSGQFAIQLDGLSSSATEPLSPSAKADGKKAWVEATDFVLKRRILFASSPIAVHRAFESVGRALKSL